MRPKRNPSKCAVANAFIDTLPPTGQTHNPNDFERGPMRRAKRADIEDAPLPLTDSRAADALPKQRRFLVLMCLTVIAYYLLKVGIKPDAQYSGLGLTLAHPERAVWALWIVWGWALVRYLQVAYALLSDIKDDLVMDIDAEDMRIARKKALRHARILAAKGELDETGRPKIQISPLIGLDESGRTTRIRMRGNQIVQYPSEYAETEDGGRKYEHISGAYQWANDEGEWGSSTYSTSMNWSAKQVRWHRRRATVSAALRLQAVTEHIAPLVLALLSLLSPLSAVVLAA